MHLLPPAAVTWSEVAARLADPRNYWLHTTHPSGRPDASPVWGVVLDAVMYIYSERSTVKAKNVQLDPRVVVHLESGSDVVIVHGQLADLGRPDAYPGVVAAFDEKYDRPDELSFLPSSNPGFDVLYALQPQRALLWSLPDTEASTRRWRA
jgi:Pyridoxamine 5'-phosphate oxidase